MVTRLNGFMGDLDQSQITSICHDLTLKLIPRTILWGQTFRYFDRILIFKNLKLQLHFFCEILKNFSNFQDFFGIFKKLLNRVRNV